MPKIIKASLLEFACDKANRKTASLQISVEYFKKGKLNNFPFNKEVDTNSFKVINSSSLRNFNLSRKL